MEFLTVVNRTSKMLKGTWDGRHFDVPPGKSMHPAQVANAIKRQNPIMGSQGHEIWDIQYLVGIEEHGDDISPVEQSDAIELINSKILHAASIAAGKKLEVVKGENGAYKTRTAVAAPITSNFAEVSFDKP